MARTIATVGTRLGIVTLAALGALALPVSVGAAAASNTSVAVAAVDCAALQVKYDGLADFEEVLQERLAEAPPAHKGAIIDQILRVQAKMAIVEQQMQAANCP